MSIKAAINGFGRIGRLAFRAGIERGDVDFAAVNAPDKTPEMVAYALRFDSVHGMFQGDISYDENSITVNGRRYPVLDQRDPARLPWKELGVEYVLECTGKFLTKAAVQPHLDAGAGLVVLSAPAKDVNHRTFDPGMRVISNASCTTNCLAPLAKVVNDRFGILEGLITTIHAGTINQNVVDNFNRSKRNFRMSRTAMDNIIMTSTGAAKAVGKVIPQLNGRLTGIAMRVPVSDVSVVDLTCKLETPTSYDDICRALKEASRGEMKGILGYTDEQVVSTDFRHDSRTCIFDATAGLALDPTFVKLIAWYDNEWAYSNKLLDLAIYADSVRKA